MSEELTRARARRGFRGRERGGAARGARRPGAGRIARALVVLSALAIVVAMLPTGGHHVAPGPPPPPAPGALDVRTAGTSLGHIELRGYVRGGQLDHAALSSAVARVVPHEKAVRRGAARIVYRYDVAGALRDAGRVTLPGRTLEVRARALAAEVAAPVVPQALRNDCEATALQVLLATVGTRVDQRRLQAELPRSGPLDPVDRGPVQVWGDPERGFVGRADGGGAAGGFGVYQGPIRALAGAHGHRLGDLTGGDPAAVYQRLLEGHAVMVWVGLSDGPYGHWRSPEGRLVGVNFGEHSVVLTGMRRDGGLTVVNPLQGTREVWTKGDFVRRWGLLGRRALTT